MIRLTDHRTGNPVYVNPDDVVKVMADSWFDKTATLVALRGAMPALVKEAPEAVVALIEAALEKSARRA